MADITALFDGMMKRFKPEKAKGEKGMFHFVLSGDGGGSYWLKVDNGQLEYGEGDPPTDSDMIMRANVDDFTKIMNGETNPMMAFMSGKVKAEKNMGMAMKLASWFGLM